jgi:hypothetical protein
MRIEDAPTAGWYPDPEGTSRLRYWEGTDWSDRFRARPAASAFDEAEPPAQQRARSRSEVDPQALVEQVRLAAREEAERAAQMFGQQARSAAADLQPLISQYTSKVARFLRVLSVLAIVVLVAWVAWQVFVQASLFEWIGDRIDGLTDPASNEPVPGFVRPWTT